MACCPRPCSLSCYLIPWAAALSGLVLLLWALVRYIQHGSQDVLDCSDRLTTNGFEGNADFYGLGIRLGFYLQWFAQLIANNLLEKVWKKALAVGLVFHMTLLLGTLILAFQKQCTFSVEIIVMLFLFAGGSLVVYIGSPIFHIEKQKFRPSKHLWTAFAVNLVYLTTHLFSLWFWIRAAAAREDYPRRSEETSYFLFARILLDVRPTAGLMAFTSATFACCSLAHLIGILVRYLKWFDLEQEVAVNSNFCGTPGRRIRERREKAKRGREALEQLRGIQPRPQTIWSTVFKPSRLRK